MVNTKSANTELFETLPVAQAVKTMAVPAVIGQLIALFLGVMRWAAFNIPMLFILNTLWGMYGIVFSQLAADILTVSLSLAVYHRFEKQHFAELAC